jgi:excisionase family DNA binding protein
VDNRALVPAPAAVASVGSSHGPPRPAPIAMTVASAMSALGIGKTKLYELLASGDLEAIRVGRRRLILQASIEALVERLREGRLAERE